MSELDVLQSRNFPPPLAESPWLKRLAVERWSDGLWFEGAEGPSSSSEIWFTFVRDGRLTTRDDFGHRTGHGPGALHITRQDHPRADGLGVAPGESCRLMMAVFDGPRAMAALHPTLPGRTGTARPAHATELAEWLETGARLFATFTFEDQLPAYTNLLIGCLTRALGNASWSASAPGFHYQRCLRLIGEIPPKNLSVELLAERMGIDRSHLSRLFRRMHGTTLRQHLNHHRLDAAATLLRTTDLTIDSVGQSVGFADGFSFSKAFRRLFKVSPKSYRR